MTPQELRELFSDAQAPSDDRAVAGQLERIADILESGLRLALVVSGKTVDEILAVNLFPAAAAEGEPEILTTPEHEIALEQAAEVERAESGFTEDEASGDDWPEGRGDQPQGG